MKFAVYRSSDVYMTKQPYPEAQCDNELTAQLIDPFLCEEGSLKFRHYPRIYFGWVEDNPRARHGWDGGG